MIPLVLVHGFMGGAAQWADQTPLSAKRELVCVDLPGFGANAGMAPLTSIAAYADWVLDALDREGHTRFDLLGHSMGGMIVQDMARRAPERLRKLVLYATGAVGVLPERFEPIAVSMERARMDGAQATAQRISATWFLHGDKAAGYPACSHVAQRAGLPAILAGLAAMREWSGAETLHQIAAPTLVIWGDQDRTYGWPQIERLWTTIPECQLAVVPNCAHAVHMEEPVLFNALLSRFLE
ncbi:alpha/beta fold hydrolase [Primorskyibacter sp. S187A]|uniref:alpha/beta fold hydrolase n=1 Tax=Primorskyibacter sp. S187A TaxID=3415130 RepID=UPI003C7C65FA